MLRRKVFKISSGAKFGKVVAFLRKQLGIGEGSEGGVGRGEGLWCYVNQSFAPALDAEVGGLWRVGLYFPGPGCCLLRRWGMYG